MAAFGSVLANVRTGFNRDLQNEQWAVDTKTGFYQRTMRVEELRAFLSGSVHRLPKLDEMVASVEVRLNCITTQVPVHYHVHSDSVALCLACAPGDTYYNYRTENGGVHTGNWQDFHEGQVLAFPRGKNHGFMTGSQTASPLWILGLTYPPVRPGDAIYNANSLQSEG